jgi:hypothetical protein
MFSVVVLNLVMLSVVILSVVMLSVIMVNVVAPWQVQYCPCRGNFLKHFVKVNKPQERGGGTFSCHPFKIFREIKKRF